jgi:hypothetical protein
MFSRPSLPVRASIRLCTAFSAVACTYTRKTFVKGSTGFLRLPWLLSIQCYNVSGGYFVAKKKSVIPSKTIIPKFGGL